MSEKAAVELTPINPPERTRTYVFPNNHRLAFANVKAVGVRPSGTHRLELADGRRVIVAPNWLAIELDVDGWTF